MTRHPTARRVHRQEAPDDAFIAGVLETTAWAKQHQRTLIISGIAAVVLITAAVLYVTNRSERRVEAALQLNQARAVALSGNAPLAIRELEQYLSRFDGTPAADEARLLLGRAYLEDGQTEQAIETTRPIARNVGADVGTNAAMLQATAHEAAGNVTQAEAVYLRVGEGARFLFQRQNALENAARIRLQTGNAAGAADLYDRLVDMTPEAAAERQIFQMRAGEARALAAAGQ